MNVEELIAKLTPLDGKLPVVVEDGMDPSDLHEVSRVEVGEESFFHDPGFDYSRERLAVRLT